MLGEHSIFPLQVPMMFKITAAATNLESINGNIKKPSDSKHFDGGACTSSS
jgi:hypothetical protein